jgi:hypothetical protein
MKKITLKGFLKKVTGRPGSRSVSVRRKNAGFGSGSALHQCGSTTLDLFIMTESMAPVDGFLNMGSGFVRLVNCEADDLGGSEHDPVCGNPAGSDCPAPPGGIHSHSSARYRKTTQHLP